MQQRGKKWKREVGCRDHSCACQGCCAHGLLLSASLRRFRALVALKASSCQLISSSYTYERMEYRMKVKLPKCCHSGLLLRKQGSLLRGVVEERGNSQADRTKYNLDYLQTTRRFHDRIREICTIHIDYVLERLHLVVVGNTSTQIQRAGQCSRRGTPKLQRKAHGGKRTLRLILTLLLLHAVISSIMLNYLGVTHRCTTANTFWLHFWIPHYVPSMPQATAVGHIEDDKWLQDTSYDTY